jgi:FtsP/CotA-like multicopper oxidase with cupredoxin domain
MKLANAWLFSALGLAIVASSLESQIIRPAARQPLPKPAAGVVRAGVHQNRVPAGRLVGNVHRIAIEIHESAWHPEGANDPEVPILAFAEAGHAPSVPGPLVRVRQGTDVVISLHNRTDSAMVVGGLRPGTANDTVQLAAGETREVRHRLDSPGTYFYWGAFKGSAAVDRFWKDSQLNGALVVDPPGGSTRDHVLVLSEWFLLTGNESFEAVQLINGKAWPHTQTLELQQGDSVRFRVVNGIAFYHPMHLHGFYYRIESRGNGARDVAIHPDSQFLSNTDVVATGGTLTLSFLASTPGNWLFHCHFAFHTDEAVTLAGAPRDSAEAAAMHAAHGDDHTGGPVAHAMRGLVMGLKVAPAPGYVETSTANAREIQLYVGKSPGRLPTGAAAIGFSLRNGPGIPAPDSVLLPGPVLELRRGQPVRIVVNNQLNEPTSIHWHGLEIESYPDGVPNFSGLGGRIYSQVAPRDSFVAEFTPTRAGTYPYHSHLNDRKQIQSGMYGALLVTDGPRDLTRDHVIVAGGGGPEIIPKFESPFALVNGRRVPPPIRLTVGETHRLRLVSIHPDWLIYFSLRNDSTVGRWRAIAKDGADLPPALATLRPANINMGPGETADFEFTPTEVGRWRIEVSTAESGGWQIVQRIIVEPKAAVRP